MYVNVVIRKSFHFNLKKVARTPAISKVFSACLLVLAIIILLLYVCWLFFYDINNYISASPSITSTSATVRGL